MTVSQSSSLILMSSLSRRIPRCDQDIEFSKGIDGLANHGFGVLASEISPVLRTPRRRQRGSPPRLPRPLTVAAAAVRRSPRSLTTTFAPCSPTSVRGAAHTPAAAGHDRHPAITEFHDWEDSHDDCPMVPANLTSSTAAVDAVNLAGGCSLIPRTSGMRRGRRLRASPPKRPMGICASTVYEHPRSMFL